MNITKMSTIAIRNKIRQIRKKYPNTYYTLSEYIKYRVVLQKRLIVKQ